MSDDVEKVCQAGDIDPDDWFIEKDGRQYPDDVLVPDEELEKVAFEARHLYVEGKEDLIIRENLRRRRRAKEACYQCPFRLECLKISLETRPEYGTFGGYYPEERRKILRLMDARRSRESRDADRPAPGVD